jgi:hypothetical protein
VLRLTLQIRRCLNAHCPQFRKPYRPEAEGRLAFPKHEFGLEVIALVGHRRYAQHRSIPAIHQALLDRGVVVAQRTVTNLLERYDALLSLTLQDPGRLRRLTAPQGRVLVALDGVPPDMGHEVLWVFRDCLSGAVLLAHSWLSASHQDLATRLRQVQRALRVPMEAVVSDGQRSIRQAVHRALPTVPHHLCHFHYVREAAKPISEADRQAQKARTKRGRGVRPMERHLATRSAPEAEVIRGYGRAVRSALPDDGRPPLDASGLTLQARLRALGDSLERVETRGPGPQRSPGCSVSSTRAYPTPRGSGPSWRRPLPG